MRMSPTYVTEASRILGLKGPFSVKVDGHGFEYTLPCTHCGPVSVHLAKRFPPDILPRKLEQAGWSTKRKLLCPTCSTATKTVQQVIVDTYSDQGDEDMSNERSPAAKQMHVQVILWLHESFDTGTGRYKAGMSDEKIADETGASKEYVATVRKEHFGDLAEPTEIAGLREELLALRRKVSQIKTDADAAVKALEAEADAISQKIDGIVLRNGWKH